MPAEWEVHRGTVICWPTRDEVWGTMRPLAEREYAALINAIAEDEPTLVVCREEDTTTVQRLCGEAGVSILIHPIDDGWIRDNGPIITRDERNASSHPQLLAVSFGFNSWGNRFTPTVGDLSVRRALAQELGVSYEDAVGDLVLEGGAISSNGAGTLLVSEECVLTDSRNPGFSQAEFERILARRLGVRKVIWVPYGLLEDLPNTDGHVDNVAVFVGPREVLIQTAERGNPNAARLAVNAELLRCAMLPDGSRLRLFECEILPYAELPDGCNQVVPYINFALTNASVIVPSAGRNDDDALAQQLFAEIFPQRQVKFTPSVALAYGGGGPHCVTLNIVGS